MELSDSSSLPVVITGLFVVYLAVLAVCIWAYVRIIHRSGYSGWWVLIGLVPIVNIIMFLIFAFKEAPTERELKQLRAWAAQARGYSGSGQQPGY